MKKASTPSLVRQRKQKPGSKGGKRSLYYPELGASNGQAAQRGRFATRVASGEHKGTPRYPAYFACKKLEGALIGLQRIRDDFTNIPLRISAVAAQTEEGLRILRAEAKKVKSHATRFVLPKQSWRRWIRCNLMKGSGGCVGEQENAHKGERTRRRRNCVAQLKRRASSFPIRNGSDSSSAPD